MAGLNVIPCLVFNEMNANMIAPFTYFEIEKSLFSLGAHKASRPNGFNGLFFLKNWDV